MSEFGKWIEVKWRDLTEEEKEYYDNDDITQMADFECPEDGQEILISQHNGEWVSMVTFCNDGDGIGDEDGNDWLYEVDAWMPLPNGFMKGKQKCPFKMGELVEVSDDNSDWYIRHFVRLYSASYDFIYVTREKDDDECCWRYCQKYGTLGGLIKEDEQNGI